MSHILINTNHEVSKHPSSRLAEATARSGRLLTFLDEKKYILVIGCRSILNSTIGELI